MHSKQIKVHLFRYIPNYWSFSNNYVFVSNFPHWYFLEVPDGFFMVLCDTDIETMRRNNIQWWCGTTGVILGLRTPSRQQLKQLWDNPMQFYRFLKTYGKPHCFFFLFPDFLKTRQDAQEWASSKVHGTFQPVIEIFYTYRILAVSITERSFRAPLGCLWMFQLGWLHWPGSAASFRAADVAPAPKTPERELACLNSNNTKRS